MGNKRWQSQTKRSLKAKDTRYRKRRDKAISEGELAPPVIYSPQENAIVEHVFKVTYICGHSGRFTDPTPKPDDHLWCYRCCDYQRVIKVDQSVLRRPVKGSGG